MKPQNPQHRQPLWPNRALAAWVAGALLALAIGSLLTNWNRVNNRNTNRQVAGEIGRLGYLLYDAANTLKVWFDDRRLAHIDSAPYVDFLASIHQSNADASTPRTAHATPRKHVIFLQMESVDGFAPAATFEGQPLMPFLYQLRHQGVEFRNALDHSSSGRTVDGEFLALTSLPPIKGKPIYANYDLGSVPSLPRVLNDAGYHTFSLHGYRGFFWNRANAHQQLGYQKSYFFADLDSSDRLGWGVSDHSALQQAAVKIKDATQPVFAHLILLTNHHPYDHVGKRLGKATGDILRDHVESLRYVDQSIEAFFATLEDSGLLDDCLIALFSDHDSAITPLLRQNVQIDKPEPVPDTVPLILYGFDLPPQRVDKAAGLQDLPVILLQELGIPPPPSFAGNALRSDRPSLDPAGQLNTVLNGQLHREPAPIDPANLSKLALLHPHLLGPSP